MNASGHKLDVWLIYRCEGCDFTWNRAVEERRTVAALGERLVRYERNDSALARQIACDVTGLARAGVAVEWADARVEREAPGTHVGVGAGAGLEIIFTVADGCVVRLDRVLARELGLSRSIRSRISADRRPAVPPPQLAGTPN